MFLWKVGASKPCRSKKRETILFPTLSRLLHELFCSMKGHGKTCEDLRASFSHFNFPELPLESTHREATLTGAVQLCTLRLQHLELLRRFHPGDLEATGVRF